ncbi:tumor necrosis factor receptor superfamily member 3 [Ictalurus furcatus]|uniref:tumor necrosis factor receptor superfamily member 3 n=1 Tax=Ictalurus furcatus TaxID=66913 RepID=UPI00234FCAA3|nr:tumor necrosis factor receptor superfamily member 3 [Ictalurus furcatus]
MSVKVLHVVICLILMSGLTSSLPLEAETRHRRAADVCTECPAGMYVSSCKCITCPENTFTNKTNREYSCLPCFMDCRAELHMQVVSPCSKVADVVCECVKGFVCSKIDVYTNQCVRCKQQPVVKTTSQPTTQTFPRTVAQTTSYAPEQTTLLPLAWTTSMNICTAQPVHDKPQGPMLQICILFLVLFILFSIITFYFYKRRKIDCLKKRLKQCSVRKQKEDSKAISSEINKPIKQLHAQEIHTQTPSTTNTDFPTPQPDSRQQPLPASGNLGPLHIYGAGTVFVSLLNQFGLNGGDKDEEDHREQPLNNNEMHSPPSPTIPLSKEEKNRDISFISFPSQEQGKECHMSKEEGL